MKKSIKERVEWLMQEFEPWELAMPVISFFFCMFATIIILRLLR